ncbi:MAG: UDP-N-acetylmuramoyl-tripeptide--D-alanyl-D-alanine ligase [Bacillaceae bacterium]|nr:UDP-N-acetylmuramoyl-tripeptide--D-alanyl-D-alanine ligase [Bacillaceae bacterium]
MKLEQNLVEKISVKTSGKVSAPYFKTVFIDSRLQVEQGLFIPIIGERFDGHEFIFDAIKNGAVATLWDVSKPIPNELIESQFPVFYVNDTLTALQQLAKHYLEFVKPRVIAVTGSNGKTSTKDLIESVVSQVYKTHKTKGNYNNHIGLPLTILSMPSDCEVIILEMGMSDFGEISLLSRIANPDFAVITNIGESHIEQLGSREGIATAKYEIIDGLKEKGVVILDGDEPLLKVYQHECLITCGYDTNNHFQITHYQMDEKWYNVLCKWKL